MTSRRPAAPDAPRPRLRVVGMLRVAIALAGVLMTPIGLISYGLGLRVPDGPSAAATTLEREIAALPGLDAVDVHPRLTDGRRDDAFSVRVRPGVPAERLRPVATAIADLLRDGGVRGDVQILRTGPGPTSSLSMPVPAPAAEAVDDALALWLDQAGPLGGVDLRMGDDPAHPDLEAWLRLPVGAGPTAVEAFDLLRAVRPPGSAPVRWSIDTGRPDGAPSTILISDRDVPPPAALRAMGSVARAVGRNEVVSVRWAVERYEPHTLVVVIGSIGSGAGDAREVEAIAERCRAALDGAEVPFLVRVL